MTRDKFFIPFLVALFLLLITTTILIMVTFQTSNPIVEQGQEVNLNLNKSDVPFRGLGRIPDYLSLDEKQLISYSSYKRIYKSQMEQLNKSDQDLNRRYIEILFKTPLDSIAIEKIVDSSAVILKQKRSVSFNFIKSMLKICNNGQKEKLILIFKNIQDDQQRKGMGRNRHRYGQSE